MPHAEGDEIRNCPLCQQDVVIHFDTNEVDCRRCGRFVIDHLISQALEEHRSLPVTNPHLLSGFVRELHDLKKQPPALTYPSSPPGLCIPGADAHFPKTIAEKARKLLASLTRKTEYFGSSVVLQPGNDYVLGYASNGEELVQLALYLEEQKLLKVLIQTSGGTEVKVTGDGIAAIESQSLSPPSTVFISSTCYDLLDLRSELAQFLESQGYVVKISEDPERFNVDPSADSIESCLVNLRSSDVVVCILDRRYGGMISTGSYQGRSATHVEIDEARRIGLPMFTFLRAQAWIEFQQINGNPDFGIKWIEPKNISSRERWTELARELVDYANAQGRHSNWFDEFRTSVDLKRLVAKRLAQFRQAL